MSYKHKIYIPAAPQHVFELLTSAAQFALATGRGAIMGAAEGEAFDLFDGYVEGRHIELVPGERVVQAWRLAEWAPGTYSLVRFSLAPSGGGTVLTVDQDGIPEGGSPLAPTWEAHVAQGWPMFYFGPMETYFKAAA